MEMVNGYVFLDLTKSNVYSKALKVLGTDKPVVIKDGSGSPYFVDSLTLSGTSVVITKGGKTITIANDNTITNVGDIQTHLYYTNISVICSDGNKCYFSISLNTTKKISSLTERELVELLNEYDGIILFGYAEYDNQTFNELTFSITYGDEDNTINEIAFNNGNTSTNTITTFTSITVNSVQIY